MALCVCVCVEGFLSEQHFYYVTAGSYLSVLALTEVMQCANSGRLGATQATRLAFGAPGMVYTHNVSTDVHNHSRATRSLVGASLTSSKLDYYKVQYRVH